MSWQVDSTETEDSWFADLVATALSSPCAVCPLPPKRASLGATTIVWFETEPGIAFIHTTGGTTDDRVLAEAVTRAELEQAGYRQAHYTFEPDEDSPLRKEATWNDVMAKAKRLIQSGNVTILRNGQNNIVGHVVGDHGEYQSEISREDPNSQVITQWQCECPWDQFAFQRTRKWKKYEARPCAHVLATYWAARRMPLDDAQPEAQGQGQLFAPGPMVGTPSPRGRPTQPVGLIPGQQLSIPGVDPGTAVSTPPGPSGAPPAPDVMPQFPGTQMQEVNPVSVPGLRQPSPANPVQYPGGTFSSVTGEWHFAGYKHKGYILDDGSEFKWDVDEDGHPHHPDMHSQLPEGRKPVAVFTDLDDGTRELFDLQGHEITNKTWQFESAKADEFENSDMAQVMKATYGVAEGKSVEHGAGGYREIPKNAIVEVLGQDPTTGWVDCIWPLNNSGPMEPYHVRAWIPAEDLTPRPDVRKPGPFIKRRSNERLAVL